MNALLKTPKAVLQAREDQKGLNLVLEILIFVAVFLVCTFGEVIAMMPVQVVLILKNKNFLDAVASGDKKLIMEASAQMASDDDALIASLFATAAMILLVIIFCKFIQKRKVWTIGFVKEKVGVEYIKGIVIGVVMFSAAVLICMVTGALKLEYVPERFASRWRLWFRRRTCGYDSTYYWYCNSLPL